MTPDAHDDDGYDHMAHDELVHRARDWRRVANERSEEIARLATELTTHELVEHNWAALLLERDQLRYLLHDMYERWADRANTLDLTADEETIFNRTITWVHRQEGRRHD